MKKSVLSLTTTFLFAIGMSLGTAHAQASGGATAGGAPGGNGANPSATQNPGSAGAMTPTPTSPSSVNQTDVGSTSQNQTLEGCVISQGGDFFLVPASSGGLIHLSGGDLSSHVGQHVKLNGPERGTGIDTGATAASSNSGSLAPGTATQTNSASGTGSNTTLAGNTVHNEKSSGESNSPANSRNWSQEMTVDKVSVISSNCPSDIQKNAPQQ